MGLLVDGVWRDDSFDKARMEGGRFNRPTTKFRNWITPDGSPGPSGEGGFAAETGRYHLYVSLACPWAHRTMIFRHLKRLENVISMSEPTYGRRMLALTLQQGRTALPVYRDSKSLLNAVAADPYAISYAWAKEASRDTRIRILKILGRE